MAILKPTAMKKIVFILLIMFLPTSYGQQGKNQLPITKVEKVNETKIVLPETIQVKDVTDRKENENSLDKNMPWIVAFSIGILSALINCLIAYKLRKSNYKNLKLQIENSREISLVHFKATIATKNRQEWINDLRNTISELISFTTAILVEMNLNKSDPNNLKEFLLKINYAQSKINMFLNSSKPEQLDLKTKVGELVSECTKKHHTSVGKVFEPKINAVVDSARVLFELHWKKVKNLE